ncbi:hypothetical protein BAE44_0007386 [Dichanthelium oligosanthes]|uniref:Uncharacterized protein n=1 Tax=Dichanthelium oligosanthes TaxID=888268 RepID=A0A1E5W2I6_9POAL|nr:hypothetical protein BAE44_0007386 [Dichanthelium oligosanthes]
MESIRLPAASLRFDPNASPDAVHHKWKMDCFGLSEDRIICADNCGLAFLYDAGLRSVVPLPALHSPKRCPISLPVPDVEEHGRGGGACLYVMEKVPRPCPDEGQVEAFVYAMSEMSYDRVESLWFGISEQDDLPCASDLSCALKGEKPGLLGVWRNRFPIEWEPLEATTQIVSLGSGRFFMLDFFHTVLEEMSLLCSLVWSCCLGENGASG